MSGLIYNDERMDAAVDFCWTIQRMFAKARFEGWHTSRVKSYIDSYKKQWKAKFPHGVREAAHLRFMDELNEQLLLEPRQRDKNKPVWLNEQLGMRTTADAAPNSDATGGDTTTLLNV